MSEQPDEIWFLQQHDEDNDLPVGFVRPIDGGPASLFLACRTEEEAQEAADYQNEVYGMNCRPVRVK